MQTCTSLNSNFVIICCYYYCSDVVHLIRIALETRSALHKNLRLELIHLESKCRTCSNHCVSWLLTLLFQRRRRLSDKASSILAPFLNERASHCNAQMHWQCQRHDTWPGLAWFCCVVYERARASTQERRASATPLSINNTNTDNDWSKKHALPLPLDTLIRPYSDGTEWKVVIIITINCHHVCCLLRFCSLFFFPSSWRAVISVDW